jgi:RimJ/RimL family protein N-acetyltransferase
VAPKATIASTSGPSIERMALIMSWALSTDARGRGYATETARAALGHGFHVLGLERIFAITKPDNRPSQAVMMRLGMTYRKNVTYKGIDAVWFEMGREKWLG